MSRPRIRSLKPECWADERVGKLSPLARLTMVGLITMADDEGRLRALTSGVIGHVFPYDDVTPAKVKRWISEIEGQGVLLTYEDDGVPYIAFRHWRRHQRINRAAPSLLPEPPDPHVVTENSVKDHGEITEETVIDHGGRTTPRAGVRSDPFLSAPDPSVSSSSVSRATDHSEHNALNGEVMTDESTLAYAVLGAFNEHAGTTYLASSWTTMIQTRIGEHPELDEAAHREILGRNFAVAWWDGSPSPSVLYKTPQLFERAMNESGDGPRKGESKGTTQLRDIHDMLAEERAKETQAQ